VNDKPILKGKVPWLIECIQSRIDKAIHDSDYIESFNITLGGRKSNGYDVINGLIGRILMQDIHDDGFKEI